MVVHYCSVYKLAAGFLGALAALSLSVLTLPFFRSSDGFRAMHFYCSWQEERAEPVNCQRDKEITKAKTMRAGAVPAEGEMAKTKAALLLATPRKRNEVAVAVAVAVAVVATK